MQTVTPIVVEQETAKAAKEMSTAQETRDALLLSLADDFKRYYFETWRSEMAQQRGSPSLSVQQGLHEGKIDDAFEKINRRLTELERQVQMNNTMIDALYECIEDVVAQCNSTESRLVRMEFRCPPVVQKQ